MSKHQLTAAEDKLLKRGFDWATDSSGYDPSRDDYDVLTYITDHPEALVKEISGALSIPNHRTVAALGRLKTAGKIQTVEPLDSFTKTKELQANYLKLVNPDCSTGNDEPLETVIDFRPEQSDLPIVESCSTGINEAVAATNCEQLTVITLWQPWATFLVKGIKCFETRSWCTNHRGKILIHAAARKLNWLEVPLAALRKYLPDIDNWDFPTGAIVGEASLINCHRVEAVRDNLDGLEKLCGDYSDGRYAWELASVKPLFIPNVKGKQGLWKYELKVDNVVLGETSQSDVTTKPDIPHWLTGRNAAEAKALCDELGFWYVGTVDNWGEPEPRKIIKISGDWQFNYDQIGMFVEARCNGGVFNINIEDEQTPEQDKELVNKAIATIKKAAEDWGLQFGQQLTIFDCENREQENILLTDPPRQVEVNGQLSIFFDDSEEPPDPDDFETGDEYEEAYDKWAALYPELERAINQAWVKAYENSHWSTGDYVQLVSDPRRIGQLIGIKNGGLYKIRFADGFTTDLKADAFLEQPFCKENSEVILGESFFKIGEFVTTNAPSFENKIFKVEKIHHTGMITVVDKTNQSFSFPANWLNHYAEKIKKSKGKILENSERKRPAKGCGSGSLVTRQANKKRNAAKGRDPDIYYVYCYSYTDNYGKEIKSSISVPREKISYVKSMIERKEHYVKIAKFLGKSLPVYY